MELEYHRSVHSELDTTPLTRYLDAHDVARANLSSAALRQAFREQVLRKQRRSDGTVSVVGRRFEIPSRYRTGDPEARIAPGADQRQRRRHAR